jgi:hypothetical protein
MRWEVEGEFAWLRIGIDGRAIVNTLMNVRILS